MPILERHAARRPEATAIVVHETGERVSWRALDSGSRRCAHLLLAAGLRTGDVVAVFMENHARYLEILWAARRIGLYYTTISTHLKPAEVDYILRDSGAKALFTSAAMAGSAGALDVSGLSLRLMLGGASQGFDDYDAALARVDADAALPEAPEGTDFLYSSGTTGRPKGIRRPIAQMAAHDLQRGDLWWKRFDEESVYLSTAPMYHAAPVRWNMNVLRAGGTCVLMSRFEPERALEAIERHRVTHAQWVPTMFIRLLRLPEAVKKRYDLGSMRVAIHAAAPCPVEVKRAMIDWWGPILVEYYSGTEAVGRTSIESREWLAHPGSVGRPELGRVHVVGDDGRELPPGAVGTVYFSGVPPFEYHNDPERTREAYDARGWATIGDMGYLDADGYLYLTDRRSHMIITGGVNVYPQETENVLATHPKVADVAVIGVPDAEYGEQVRAVVVPVDASDAGEALGAELIAYCRARISPIKCPRGVDFVDALPRTDTGKLLKRLLRDRHASR
jgi:long-chain acyl-CoA synthetase